MSGLRALYEAHHGKVSDKWSSYLEIYDELLNSYRNRPVRVLEIGIQNGGSLEIWSKFFPKAERILGCDINPLCAQLTYDDPRISVVVGDASAPDTVARLTKLCDGFDIVIDDGSHRSDDIVRSFALYFPLIAERGIFVAEDLHCSYWESFQGGAEAPYSSISFFKRLADYVNREHWGAPVAQELLLSFFAQHWQTPFDPAALEQITEVRFRNSLAAVFKGSVHANKLGTRVVVGDSAVVDTAVTQMNGTLSTAPNQSGNAFGPLGPRLEEAAQSRQTAEAELAALSERIADLTQAETQARARSTAVEAQYQNLRQRAERTELALFRARRQPVQTAGRLLAFHMLKALSKASPPFSARQAARLARSAAKRDPRRPSLDIVDAGATESSST